MALTILNSANSFIRFDEVPPAEHCIWGSTDYCLPVFADADVNFQFVINGTIAEIESLCLQDAGEVEVSLIEDCNEAPILVFTDKPQRFKISQTQVLYNWEHGLPNFTSVVAINQCFKVQVIIQDSAYGYVGEYKFCSNCFERIFEECFTSVIEYGNEEDAFGFKYCSGGELEEDTAIDCSPTIVQFIGVATLDIPYTAFLQAKYGDFPTVQAWIYDGSGQLINMGITIAFDAYPPTMIHLDFGGISTGVAIIR